MTDLERLRIMAQALLAAEPGLLTQTRIRQVIANVRPSCDDVTDEEAEALALSFEESYGIVIQPAAALQLPFEQWLAARRSEIDPYYWDRYRQLLIQKGLPPQVVAQIGSDTDRIVGFLENPEKLGKWSRRGMVMGHVQSGKTANYIGVATKAADAGYRVIVIIAGVQNRLRDQTQRRVDEGLIGIDTAAGVQGPGLPPIGVGLFGLTRKPATLTSAIKDFRKDAAEQLGFPLRNLREPVVFVIKKNPHTLRNLIDWLKTHNARLGTDTIDEPMLLVDDEADNASINIQQRLQKISTINGLLRELLNLFERSCYVGYTATPFANIFIDPDDDDEMLGHDLFPRHFIVCLNPPSNYFGANEVFRDPASNVLCGVDDHRDLLPMSHSKHHVVTELPQSLANAIRVFLVARAIRLARGQRGMHNSMLINVSRFVAVQRQVRNEVQSVVDGIAASVRVNGGKPAEEAIEDPEIGALHRVFRDEYEDTCGHTWAETQRYLHESVSAVGIVEINNESPHSLKYEDYKDSGLNVIAVGGMSLSRGLTLEGLTVSYVLRRSMMYDTLFQMGRWFGYRDGYNDLCRVWMPEEAQGWYEHIAESVDELRKELNRMQSGNATPEEFGLKVRAHPDALVVTARNKMGSSKRHKVMIRLATQFVETGILYADRPTIEGNLAAVRRLAERMRAGGLAPERGRPASGGRLVRDVPVGIVDEFLAAFRNHPASGKSESGPVRQYIADRMDELREWDVLFAGVQKKTRRSRVGNWLGFKLVCQRRMAGKRSTDSALWITNKQRVASRGVEKIGLDDAQIEKAERAYREADPETTNYPDHIYRKERTKPLLIIHLLAIGEESEDLTRADPVAAWSLSFPGTARQEDRVEYLVNKTWVQEHLGDGDMDDDDE